MLISIAWETVQCFFRMYSLQTINNMKLPFLLVLTALLSVSLQAQNRISIGAKAGLNMSNIYDSEGNTYSADAKPGFAAGGFVFIPIGGFFGVQPEMMFSQKGYTTAGSVLGLDYSTSRTSNYLDIPILLAIRPLGLATFLIGPQYSYLMKQSTNVVTPVSNTTVVDEFTNDNIRRNTLGLVLGADVNLSALVLSGRVAWDLYDNNGDGTSTTPRYKNVVGQVTLGFRF
jgi:hypothetical protein